MKNSILTVSVLLLLIASSCKKESKLIIGTWKDVEDDCVGSTITFKEDKTYTENYPCAEDGEDEISVGTYEVDKDEITINYNTILGPFQVTGTIVDIDKESMKLNLLGIEVNYSKVN